MVCEEGCVYSSTAVVCKKEGVCIACSVTLEVAISGDKEEANTGLRANQQYILGCGTARTITRSIAGDHVLTAGIWIVSKSGRCMRATTTCTLRTDHIRC
jgi:hypothetical protein